jgi:hypothetical protein
LEIAMRFHFHLYAVFARLGENSIHKMQSTMLPQANGALYASASAERRYIK